MKDKTIAAILAFFGGIVGLHRFYLGQRGWGVANVFFFSMAIASGDATFFVMLSTLAAVFGVIDAIGYLSMDEAAFNQKFNQPSVVTNKRQRSWKKNLSTAMNDRERRFQERQRERAERERAREREAKLKYGQRVSRGGGSRSGGGGHVNRTGAGAGAAERAAGVRYFKDFEYAEAIQAFKRALEKDPRDVATHFNIACTYSCEERADEAFYHLDRAVALGFDDFTRIKNHDGLAFLRVQSRYPDFEKNNFRLAAELTPEAPDERDTISASGPPALEAPPVRDDLLEQLQRLANLREKGLLTEGEFVAQKRRLLG